MGERREKGEREESERPDKERERKHIHTLSSATEEAQRRKCTYSLFLSRARIDERSSVATHCSSVIDTSMVSS